MRTQATYEDNLKSSKRVPEKTLFKLARKVKELQDLLLEVRNLTTELSVIRGGKCQNESCDLVKENVASALTSLSKRLDEAVKKLSKHQRTAASHIFVVLISRESRSRRPYAVPVQCLPIRGLKDKQAREIANRIIVEMTERNMKVAGEEVFTCVKECAKKWSQFSSKEVSFNSLPTVQP